MHLRIRSLQMLTGIVLLLLCADAARGEGAGQVRLELFGGGQGTAMLFQDWGQALAGAGIKNVRFRSKAPADKVGLDVQKVGDRPLYIVTGEVLSRDEILLPAARFKRSEVKRLVEWLDDLAQKGPEDKRPKPVAFGLTAAELERIKKDLSASVGFSTVGMARREAVERITGKLSTPLRFEEKFSQAAGDEKVEDELSDLSAGTALACVLREADLVLVPQAINKEIRYSVVKAQPNVKEFWPTGRRPERPTPQVLPGLFELMPINVQNFPAAAVLDQVSKRVKTPVVYDRAALAKYKIDPAKARVSYPSSRANYSMALEKMLFPAGMEYEVRMDDAGKAFLWVTTVRPF
jgi:hypothetical protein